MGNHLSHGLQQNGIAVLRKETQFSVGEISDMYRQYRMDTSDLTMTPQYFIDMYAPVYSHGHPENQRIFSTFDKKKDGHVNFHEFLTAPDIHFKGTVEMKQGLVCDVIDHRQKGAVDIDAIKEVIEVLEGLNAGVLPDDFQFIDALYCIILHYIALYCIILRNHLNHWWRQLTCDEKRLCVSRNIVRPRTTSRRGRHPRRPDAVRNETPADRH
ncbi:hypothetical protein CAPTEDRAFT_225273 [Capitella teleta]|uniref:EF-hand domain-containing protein n=1 Tax=Capitella teleta TaxID=283909 RepID=R7U450_CAPTE|nr:hypothetical protein CAPTEDRAFT_225273 [Capitella teleta]|eukprot:ELT98451.1 hypothetical protein CAPTEDRAFT_225273 [Capitella teleta]